MGRFAFFLLVLVTVAGCIEAKNVSVPESTNLPYFKSGDITEVRDRVHIPFKTDGQYSMVLEPGILKILPALSVFVDVAPPLGNGAPAQRAHMGVFLPEVPSGTKVPVIVDAGPYYADGDAPATTPAGRLGQFLIENFVPLGYAVAQLSVLGTGNSEGCMDLMGTTEQAGINAALEWLGTQPWSNGNVAFIGRSYDGSTPWEAAMSGSPYLKTIVPISGLTGVHELMWRNGSAESRGPGVLWALYYIDPFQGNSDNVAQAREAAYGTPCPKSALGPGMGVGAWATGDYVAPQANDYWTSRQFADRALANFKGSVYYIHGLQDWNVDPHIAFPMYQRVQAAGLEEKGLFGQWGHMYPDRPSEHQTLSKTEGKEAFPKVVRWDWAQDLLEWFDHYLKGTGPRPELQAEVQDADGSWRVESTYPPADKEWKAFALGTDLLPQSGNADRVMAGQTMRFHSAPLAAPLRIAGLAQFHVKVTPLGPGGQLYAELRDVDQAGRRLGHAIMDLRLAAGGKDAKPVTPGMPIVAKMEFEPMDVLVPAGHTLELFVANTGRDYLPSPVSDPVTVDVGASSVLRLPTVERGPEAFFDPPAWTPATPR